MDDFIDLYIKHLRKRKCSPLTVQHYEDYLRRFHTHLQEEHQASLSIHGIERVTNAVLEAYNDRLTGQEGLSISTRNNYITILKSFFAFLVSRKIIPDNPAVTLCQIKDRYNDEPQKDEDDQFYDQSQIEMLYEHLNALGTKTSLRDLALVALMLGTGMRVSEACSLNVGQINQIEKGVLRCRRKGGRWQRIAVAPFVTDHIKRYMNTRPPCQDDEPLFLSSHGRRLTRQAAWKSLSKKQQAVGIHTGVHILRHTTLTALEEVGGMMVAGDAGDHRSLATTAGYAHRKTNRVGSALQKVSYGAVFSQEVD